MTEAISELCIVWKMYLQIPLVLVTGFQFPLQFEVSFSDHRILTALHRRSTVLTPVSYTLCKNFPSPLRSQSPCETHPACNHLVLSQALSLYIETYMNNFVLYIAFYDVHRDILTTTPLSLDLFRCHSHRSTSHNSLALDNNYAPKCYHFSNIAVLSASTRFLQTRIAFDKLLRNV